MGKLEIHGYTLAVSVLVFQITQVLSKMGVLHGLISGIHALYEKEESGGKRVSDHKFATLAVCGVTPKLEIIIHACKLGRGNHERVVDIEWNNVDFQLVLGVEKILSSTLEWCPIAPNHSFFLKGFLKGHIPPNLELERRFIETADSMYPGIPIV